ALPIWKSSGCSRCRLPVCGEICAAPNGTVWPCTGSLTSCTALADQVLSNWRYSNNSTSRPKLGRRAAALTCSHSGRPALSAAALDRKRILSCSQAASQQVQRCFLHVARKDFFMTDLQERRRRIAPPGV